VTPVQAARRPWEEEEFWPIIFKAIIRGLFSIASTLLKSLENHPQPSISTFATILDRHLESAPRSTDPVYTQEHQFYYAHVGWKNALKAQVMAFGRGRPRGEWFEYEDEGRGDVSDDIRDQMRDWEEYLMVVADLLSGDEEVVLRECEDWMEVLGAWGVLVDVKLKRAELP
jgi:nuclear pore complex protein Nup85